MLMNFLKIHKFGIWIEPATYGPIHGGGAPPADVDYGQQCPELTDESSGVRKTLWVHSKKNTRELETGDFKPFKAMYMWGHPAVT